MIIWTPAVLSVLYACVSYFCICTCSAQLGMFHMERRSRNILITILITINIASFPAHQVNTLPQDHQDGSNVAATVGKNDLLTNTAQCNVWENRNSCNHMLSVSIHVKKKCL